jgi:hypothetical protein
MEEKKASYQIFVHLFFVYDIHREVGKALAMIIALALGLDANFFDKPETLGEPIAILRLLHYQGIELVVSFGPLHLVHNFYYCVNKSSLLS